MSDFINRADAIEAVCDVVMSEYDLSPTYGYEVAEKALSTLPSADTVEIVRCKDCTHHDDFFIGAEGSLLCWKGGTDRVVSAMGYCECGERSEE